MGNSRYVGVREILGTNELPLMDRSKCCSSKLR